MTIHVKTCRFSVINNKNQIRKNKKKIDPAFEKTNSQLSKTRRIAFTSLSSLGLFGFSQAVWAIPSPDLVINMFGSAAQLLGLSAAVLGAGVFRRNKNKKGVGGNRWIFYSLIALLVGSIAANILQFSAHSDENSNRLTTNLWRQSTETGTTVGDASLKTLALSGQLEHPQGLSTDAFQSMVSEGKPLNIIDVREPEEFEMGHAANAQHSRYPDTRVNFKQLLAPNKENVLICYSGNRSSELCTEFSAIGESCRFVVGGYEKLIAEGSPLVDKPSSAGNTLRDLPGYKNDDVLLSTEQTMTFVDEQNAQFIDVRYPGDFELGHLPNALNIPLRKMTDAKIEAAFKDIPRQPVIAACYDKRSCFYSSILGLKLSRLGYDFLGRYTVPHEYAIPKQEKSYVEQWKNIQQGKTVFDLVIDPLQSSLVWLTGKTGSFTAAIFILVVLLRLLVMPLTIKAERDSLIQRRLKPDMANIKTRWGHQQHRVSREIKRLYQQHNLTPGRNFVGSIIQISFFLMFFSAINAASIGVQERFLWVPRLGEADPTGLLAIAVAALVILHLLSTTEKRGLLFNSLYLGTGILLLVLTYNLPAAANVYLILSMGFLYVQNRWVNLKYGNSEKKEPVQQDLTNNTIFPLAGTGHLSFVGNKAARLAQMANANLPVPDGFVVTENAFIAGTDKHPFSISDQDQKMIFNLFDGLNAEKVAARSSSLSEDGSEQSFAGVFESILNVSRDCIIDGLCEVRHSFSNERAQSYSNQSNEQGSVLVQKMVDAEYAGVMFTEHPSSTGCMLIEVVKGLGENLVSGQSTPHSFCFGRLSGIPFDQDEKSPIDLSELVKLGHQVEAFFEGPQDIEWAYAKGQFYLLQARDITRSIVNGSSQRAERETERSRILALGAKDASQSSDILFSQDELTALLPKPTPMSLSLMQALWEAGGTTDIACARLGLPYHVYADSAPYIVTLFGKLFVNRKEGQRRFGTPGALTSFRLSRAADRLEKDFHEDFSPGFKKAMRLREALNYSSFKDAELLTMLHEWFDDFISESYVQAETINIAADFYMKAARQALEKRDMNPIVYLGHTSETVVHKAMSMLSQIQRNERPLSDFIDLFGHRAVHDYELSEPRYQEDSQLIESLIETASHSSTQKHDDSSHLPKEKLLRASVERAKRFQVLKEDAKHHCMRALSSIRSLLLAIDERLELDGNIFYLTVEEAIGMSTASHAVTCEIIARRRQEQVALNDFKLPAELSLFDLENIDFDHANDAIIHKLPATALLGTRVAGEHDSIGVVRVLDEDSALDCFEQDEILVTRCTDPKWIPLFSKASGIVTEVGGWLSHAAIVAREYNTPCIVGVASVTSQLKTGQKVRLCGNGMVDRRLSTDRRASAKAAMDSNRRVTGRRNEDLNEDPNEGLDVDA